MSCCSTLPNWLGVALRIRDRHALLDDVLTPYSYYITPVYLEEDESELYIELTKKLAQALLYSASDLNESAKSIIRKRNNIVSNAKLKRDALVELLKRENIKDKKHTLFYVGEGRAQHEDLESLDTNDIKELNNIAMALQELGWKLSKFTSDENKSERLSILKSFESGDIDALISMRVLDEGIDIPACSRAFILASSSSSRQFIQRRGRVLRKSKNKKQAFIYDFVVLPRARYIDDKSFRSLVERELKRVREFSSLARNVLECEEVISKIFGDFNSYC